MIICMTLPFLEHKDINNDLKQLDIDLSDFFARTESYIWADVLPKKGKVKYPWINFSRELHRHAANGERYRKYEYRKSQTKVFNIFSPHVSDKHSVDNEPDPQPPEEVITQSDVMDPPEEVLSLFIIFRGQWRNVVYSIQGASNKGIA